MPDSRDCTPAHPKALVAIAAAERLILELKQGSLGGAWIACSQVQRQIDELTAERREACVAPTDSLSDRSVDPIRAEVAAVLDLIDRAASDLRRGWLAAAYDVLGRARHHLEKAMAAPERRHE